MNFIEYDDIGPKSQLDFCPHAKITIDYTFNPIFFV